MHNGDMAREMVMGLTVKREAPLTLKHIGPYKVVRKHRVQEARATGLKPDWYEYQVVEGNRILARFDWISDAERDASRRLEERWDAIGKVQQGFLNAQ